MLLDGVQVVLVKTRFPENIGMAARACANMGCPGIRLVDPERWDREKAAPLATPKGQNLLDNVLVSPDLAKAVAASSLVLGTTARTGGWRQALLAPGQAAREVAAALVRGVADGLQKAGLRVGGFDAVMTSTVRSGSGLSSSAAVEVLLCAIFDELYNDGKLDFKRRAQISQYAENVYFGKPSGLMDQMASSAGGLVYIDFADPKNPVVEKVDYDFDHSGYTLCTIDSGADHADLTDEYAAMPVEMKAVAAFFGKEVLHDVDETAFYRHIAEVRKVTGDRAVLRAIHFFNENRRVKSQVQALKEGDFDAFLRLVNASGMASWTLLQNVTPAGYIQKQDMAFTIALCQQLLEGEGAVRIHGGGFAGTAVAFVPNDRFDRFKTCVERVLGEGHCHKLTIR